MANQSIYNAFERMWQHIANVIGTKADKSEVPTKMSQLEQDVNFNDDDLTIICDSTFSPEHCKTLHLASGNRVYDVFSRAVNNEPVKVRLRNTNWGEVAEASCILADVEDGTFLISFDVNTYPDGERFSVTVKMDWSEIQTNGYTETLKNVTVEREDYDLIISLNSWDNLTKDNFTIISGNLSTVYEKYQSEIVPRVLLKRDFAYNSDYSVELYESKSVSIGFGSGKSVSIIFDDVAPHGYFDRTQTFIIRSYGVDVDNNIITEVDFTKDNHSVEIKFEMPYGTFPEQMAVQDFSYNSDDIKLLYDTLYHNANTDFVNVLLKGVYYFGTGYSYPVNIEASNVYIQKGTSYSSKHVYIDFTTSSVPYLNGKEGIFYTLQFDCDSNGVFTLSYCKSKPYLDITFNMGHDLSSLQTSDLSYSSEQIVKMWDYLLENDSNIKDPDINIYGAAWLDSGGAYKVKLGVTNVTVRADRFSIYFTYLRYDNYVEGTGQINFVKTSDTAMVINLNMTPFVQ